MSDQLYVSLVTAIITISAAILGYLFREYRNRVKPFLLIQNIEGNFTKTTESVKIPDSIILLLEKSRFINKLNKNDSLINIRDSYKYISSIEIVSKEIIEKMNNLIVSLEESNLELSKRNLSELLVYRMFESWLIRLLASDELNIKSSTDESPEIIPVFSSDEFNGSIWFAFPENSVQFGNAFNTHIILKSKCEPFIEIVKKFDIPQLLNVIKDVFTIIKKEIEISKELYPQLEDIMNQNGRWEFRMYLANLGKHPFLIEKKATLHILDDNGGKYNEECYLVSLAKDDKGNTLRTDAKFPLIVGSEKNVEFSFFTFNTQGQMKKGSIIRQIFNDGSGKCFISLGVNKPGIIKHSNIKTQRSIFEDVTKEA